MKIADDLPLKLVRLREQQKVPTKSPRAKKTEESQAAFGNRFGVEQATVSRWESGKSVPDRPLWQAIADLAGVHPARFFFNSDTEELPAVADVSIANENAFGEPVEAPLPRPKDSDTLLVSVGTLRDLIREALTDEGLPVQEAAAYAGGVIVSIVAHRSESTLLQIAGPSPRAPA